MRPGLFLLVLVAMPAFCLAQVDLSQARDLRHGGRPEQALTLLDSSSADPRVRGERALCLVDLGRVEEARALAVPASAEAEVPLPLAAAQLRLALLDGPADRALAAVEQALEIAPQSLDLLALRVAALVELERFAEAQEQLDAPPLASRPVLAQRLRVDLLLARARLEADDPDLLERAIPRLEEALALQPHRLDVRAELVRALGRFHRGERAELLAREGLATAAAGSGRADLLVALADVQRSLLRTDDALATLQLVLESDPSDRPAQVELARCELAAGRPDRAVTVLHACLEREPDSGAALLVLAEAELAQRNGAAAEQALLGLLERSPHNARGLYMHARVLRLQQRDVEAEVALRKYLDRRRLLASR